MEYIFSNVPHWHMLLNHAPSIGIVIVLGLYLTSFYLKSEDLNRASLVLSWYWVAGDSDLPQRCCNKMGDRKQY